MPEELDQTHQSETTTSEVVDTTVATPEATEAKPESAGKPAEDKPREAQIEIHVDGITPEPKEPAAAPWVTELRKKYRESEREKTELKRRLEALERPAGAPADPGVKPTVESCDYDVAEFEKKLEKWHADRKAKEEFDTRTVEAQQAHQAVWGQKLSAYQGQRAVMLEQLPNFAEAESAVKAALNPQQQDVILHVAKDSALVVAALGQNPKLAQDLAKIMDPILFGAEVGRLEARLKTVKKSNNPPPPEETPKGSASKSGVDHTYEKLLKEAGETGDTSKVSAYLRTKRQHAKG